MIRSIIIAILLVCSVSFTAFAYPSQHHNRPSHNQHHNRHDRNDRFSVNITSSGRGYVSPKGHMTVRRGQTIHIAFRPVKGYFVRRVVINGRNAGRSHDYTLRNINRNYRVHVEFDRDHRGYHRPHHR